MPQIIIADTSCLILLHKIDELELLEKSYGQVAITEIVAKEFGQPLPEWINVKKTDKSTQKSFEPFLDEGEASAISLALQEKVPLLIIDELKGRKIAKELGIKYTGTLGVIGAAKITGKIDLVKPIIDKIKATDFRVSEELLEKVLKQCDE